MNGGLFFVFYNNIKKQEPSKMKRKAKLNAEKRSKYFFAPCGSCLVNSRKVIKLAREEMSVPQPPIFTPKSRGV